MPTLATIDELLAEANTSSDVETLSRRLEEAARQALDYLAWTKILERLPPTTPDPVKRDLMMRALGAASSRGEVWGLSAPLVMMVRDFGLRDYARRLLLDEERFMSNHRSPEPHEFGVLAQTWLAVMGDAADAKRALETGWARAWEARSVEQLGRLANRWRSLDENEARAKFAEVEAAAETWGSLEATIYWWNALGDAKRAIVVRDRVLAKANEFSDALSLATFWNLHGPKPGIEMAFDLAESLATTAEDWLELAAQANWKENETKARVRRALDHAAAIATDSVLRAKTAAAYVAWLDDEAAAQAMNVENPTPGQTRAVHVTLDDWPSSPELLFTWLCDHISDASVETIALADYGHAAEKNRAALDEIRHTKRVPPALHWHPLEVCQLTRWSSSDPMAQLFAATLLRLAHEDDELVYTAPALILSSRAIGAPAIELTEQLLAWCFTITDGESPESLVALLAIFLLRASHAPDDARLQSLLARIAASPVVYGLREQLASSVARDAWQTILDELLPPLTAHESLASGIRALNIGGTGTK